MNLQSKPKTCKRNESKSNGLTSYVFNRVVDRAGLCDNRSGDSLNSLCRITPARITRDEARSDLGTQVQGRLVKNRTKSESKTTLDEQELKAHLSRHVALVDVKLRDPRVLLVTDFDRELEEQRW